MELHLLDDLGSGEAEVSISAAIEHHLADANEFTSSADGSKRGEIRLHVFTAQRLKEMLLKKREDRFAGNHLHDFAAYGVAGALVLMLGIGLKRGIQIGDFLFKIVERVAPVVIKAGVMKVKVANGRRVRILERREHGEVFFGRVIDVDQPPGRSNSEKDTGKEFGGGIKIADCIGGKWRPLNAAAGPVAVRLVNDDHAVTDDADTEALAGIFEPRFAFGIDAGDGIGSSCRLRPACPRGPCAPRNARPRWGWQMPADKACHSRSNIA